MIVTMLLLVSTASLMFPNYSMGAALTSVYSIPTNNIANTVGSYEIIFTTATTGLIDGIQIAFPSSFVPIPSPFYAHFDVSSPVLLNTIGIGAGTLSSNVKDSTASTSYNYIHCNVSCKRSSRDSNKT
jgi:hypothetical protein